MASWRRKSQMLRGYFHRSEFFQFPNDIYFIFSWYMQQMHFTVYLLCDFKNELGIDEITFQKSSGWTSWG